MKAVLSFSLPEEQDEHRMAIQAADMQDAVAHFDRWLRHEIKYAERTEQETRTFLRVRRKLADMLDDYGVDIHD